MELYRALAALCERPTSELQPVANSLEAGILPPVSEHTEIFSLQRRPYASIYLSDDGRLGGEARDRIAGFWRVLGLEPPRECDHLAVLLAFYAALWSREQEAPQLSSSRERCAHLRTTFLHEHLLSWLHPFLFKIDSFGSGFYCHWATLLAAALQKDAHQPESPRERPLHLRSTRPLPAATDLDRESLVALLTTPARSGLLLTRADLTSAARHLGIAGRVGERAFMLEAMLSQQSRAVLTWLSDFLRQERENRQAQVAWGNMMSEWTTRLQATSALIESILGSEDSSL